MTYNEYNYAWENMQKTPLIMFFQEHLFVTQATVSAYRIA